MVYILRQLKCVQQHKMHSRRDTATFTCSGFWTSHYFLSGHYVAFIPTTAIQQKGSNRKNKNAKEWHTKRNRFTETNVDPHNALYGSKRIGVKLTKYLFVYK